jgi:ATP-dependent helicase IRC3
MAGDPIKLTTKVGRGLRLSPNTGKEDCLIVDIVDSVGRANGMLVSPTLFGLAHDELAEEERERAEARENTQGSVIYNIEDTSLTI